MIGHLVTVVISMAAFWLLYASDLATHEDVEKIVDREIVAKTISRQEVSSMIVKEAPYVKDQKLIENAIVKHTQAIESLNENIVQLRIQLEKQNARANK